MVKASFAKQVGTPTVYVKEKFSAWTYNDIKTKRQIFLPGGVMSSDAGDIACIIPTAIIKMGRQETIAIQFEQTTSQGHLVVSGELEKLRSKGAIQKFGMQVISKVVFADMLEKTGERKDGQIGQVKLSFWLQLRGQNRVHKLTSVEAYLRSKRHPGDIRLNRIRPGTVFGPALFCPDWWCLVPYCHSHWYWFPGVGATTSCGGRCLFGGTACLCWIGPVPAGWVPNCAGLKTCWC